MMMVDCLFQMTLGHLGSHEEKPAVGITLRGSCGAFSESSAWAAVFVI